jgi:hypothetical protein
MTKPPITIAYQETAFTIQWDENPQAIHDQVYQVMLDGEHIPDGELTRPFVYDVTLLDQASRLALVTARGMALRPTVHPEPGKLTVRDGDTLRVRVRLSAQKRRTETTSKGRGKKLHVRVEAHDVEPWAIELFQRNGMLAETIKLLDYRKHEVHKSQQVFPLCQANVEAEVTVTSAVDFTKAFLTGIGRQKGYGLGMLEVIS